MPTDCNLSECELKERIKLLIGGDGLPDDVVGISVVQGIRDGVCVDKIYLAYDNGQVGIIYEDGGTDSHDCDGLPLPRECSATQDHEHQIKFRCDPDGNEVMIEYYRLDGLPEPTVYTDVTTGAIRAGDPKTLMVCDDKEREAELVPICIGGTEKGYAVVPFEDGVHLDPIAFKDSKLVTIPEPADWELGDCPKVCEEKIASFTGDQLSASTFPFNKITIIKPKCCTVVVETSAGTVTLSGNVNVWSEEFDCAQDLIKLTGSCDASKVEVFIKSN